MATFELIDDGVYKVDGSITEEDVERINSFPIRTCIVLQNTKDQSSEIIGQINTDNAYFSILGGLDYFEKDKYDDKDYRERTYSAPKGLAKILQYFERIESEMNPEWTNTQKCMYAYNALAVDIEYVRDLEQDILSQGVTERGLNGILYNKLTCAGMAQTFKEMMDRLGIPCYYQNQRHVHAFNIVELDGKYRGLDVTWDSAKAVDKECSFKNFGRDANFYQKYGHQIGTDSEETVFDLTAFTDQEISDNYTVIESAIKERRKITNPFRDFDRDRKRKFLPVDRFKEELEEEEKNLLKLERLKQMGVESIDIEEMLQASSGRHGFIEDYLEGEGRFLDFEVDDELKQYSGLSTEDRATRILEDVKKYYMSYFSDGASQIDDMIETHTMLDNIPPEMARKVATLKAQLFTKITLFANGKGFFEKLGIPKEEIELVSSKARGYLRSSREKSEKENPKLKHENDLDFLYAIIQNDIIDIKSIGRDYSEQDFLKLIEDVRTNWKESEFSNEEFRTLLNEALNKTINPIQTKADMHINPVLSPEQALDVSEQITDFESQVRGDLSRGENALGDVEQGEETR